MSDVPTRNSAEFEAAEMAKWLTDNGFEGRHVVKVLVLGNSGAGKSFACNALVGADVFENRTQATSVTAANTFVAAVLGDTAYVICNIPGLIEADQHNVPRNKAAIEAAFEFQRGCPTLALFVASPTGGRVKNEDYQAIHAVQRYVDLDPRATTFLVNGVEWDEIDDEAAYRAAVEQQVRTIVHPGMRTAFTAKLTRKQRTDFACAAMKAFQVTVEKAILDATPVALSAADDASLQPIEDVALAEGIAATQQTAAAHAAENMREMAEQRENARERIEQRVSTYRVAVAELVEPLLHEFRHQASKPSPSPPAPARPRFVHMLAVVNATKCAIDAETIEDRDRACDEYGLRYEHFCDIVRLLDDANTAFVRHNDALQQRISSYLHEVPVAGECSADAVRQLATEQARGYDEDIEGVFEAVRAILASSVSFAGHEYSLVLEAATAYARTTAAAAAATASHVGDATLVATTTAITCCAVVGGLLGHCFDFKGFMSDAPEVLKRKYEEEVGRGLSMVVDAAAPDADQQQFRFTAALSRLAAASSPPDGADLTDALAALSRLKCAAAPPQPPAADVRTVACFLPGLAGVVASPELYPQFDLRHAFKELAIALHVAYDALDSCALPAYSTVSAVAVQAVLTEVDVKLTRRLTEGSASTSGIHRGANGDNDDADEDASAAAAVPLWAALVLHLYAMPRHRSQRTSLNAAVGCTLMHQKAADAVVASGFIDLLFRAFTHVPPSTASSSVAARVTAMWPEGTERESMLNFARLGAFEETLGRILEGGEGASGLPPRRPPAPEPHSLSAPGGATKLTPCSV